MHETIIYFIGVQRPRIRPAGRAGAAAAAPKGDALAFPSALTPNVRSLVILSPCIAGRGRGLGGVSSRRESLTHREK
jgi:hypothetical protein